jgi:hypothetical protein
MAHEEQRDTAERRSPEKGARDGHTGSDVASWAIVTLMAIAAWVASYLFAPVTP